MSLILDILNHPSSQRFHRPAVDPFSVQNAICTCITFSLYVLYHLSHLNPFSLKQYQRRIADSPNASKPCRCRVLKGWRAELLIRRHVLRTVGSRQPTSLWKGGQEQSRRKVTHRIERKHGEKCCLLLE